MPVLLLAFIVLSWTVIASGVVIAGFSLAELKRARTKTGKMKAKMRGSAWRSLLLAGFLVLGACGRLLHGTVSLVLLGLSVCLVLASLTAEVRAARQA
jgi:hypothetical protein